MSVTAAHRWLQGAFAATRPLLRSYEGSTVCYTYDQAMGVCAFVALRDFDSAHRLLLALAALQLPSGAFYTAYWDNGAPQEYNQHVGPVLWVALAALLYERHTNAQEFRPLALKAAQWARQFRGADGALNGGIDWNGHRIAWASVEHNLDALSCFRLLGMESDVELVRSFLQRSWRAAEGRMQAGRGDARHVLDTNSWMILACEEAADVPQGAFASALSYCERTFAYADRATGVGGFDFSRIASPSEVPAHDTFRAAPVDDVWLEGTAHMALAYKLCGRTDQAAALLAQIGKVQAASGGVPYSLRGTHNGYWQMEKAPSVAATAWLVLAARGVNPLGADTALKA